MTFHVDVKKFTSLEASFKPLVTIVQHQFCIKAELKYRRYVFTELRCYGPQYAIPRKIEVLDFDEATIQGCF